MATEFLVEVITPERTFFCDAVESVIVPTTDGQMSIQNNHENMVISVVPGELKINHKGKWLVASVSMGFVEIRPDETIIFTQSAEWPEEIDEKRALMAKEKAEALLKGKLSKKEYIQNKISLAKAMTRLALSKRKLK